MVGNRFVLSHAIEINKLYDEFGIVGVVERLKR